MGSGTSGAPPESFPIQTGDVLVGKYRVDRILGQGGMGIVVAATHLQLHQQVAIKFMLPEALGQPTLVERFAREARAAVRLRSDHVARVLDVGTLDSGSPYMVMEYLAGSDLGSLLETHGPMPIEVAVDCVLQACDAVAEAHSLGIVHRDLKPRNLFLTQRNDGRGLVKVLDFGIAKYRATPDLSLTSTTDVMGSPKYMSPEQLRASRAVDERSDIWSLGVILYELLSASLPFEGESITQHITMVLTEPPKPIRAVRPDVPADLARIIERCLEKQPAARFASVAELALAIGPFAPADSRELATRIGRITGDSRPAVLQSASATSLRAPGATTANWWARTELARPSRGIVVALAVSAVALLGLFGAFGVRSLSRRPPASVVSALSTATATPNEIPTATPTPAAIATLTATMLSTSSPVPEAAPPRSPRLRRDVIPPPAASASAGEPPAYRTIW